MIKLKTAVLLHAYNANEKNWEYVVWGVPPNKPGRIPTAVAVALEEDAEHLILFGSSSGKTEQGGAWRSSGLCMNDLLFSLVDALKEFTILHALRMTSLDKIRAKLSVFELIEGPERPANTLEELQVIARIFHERELKIQKLICVSSPDHMSRLFRDAQIVFKDNPLAPHISVRGAVTLYAERDEITPPERASMANVVVAEPRATVTPYLQRMFEIGNNPDALAKIDRVLKKYGK